jgi:cadmium resistance protein CadD (predicted permease)
MVRNKSGLIIWLARALMFAGILLLVAPNLLFEASTKQFDQHFYSGMIGMLLIFVGVTIIKVNRQNSEKE